MEALSPAPFFALVTFFGMLITTEIGRRLGRRRGEVAPEAARAGMGMVDGALFALLGLLLGFSFYGAGERFDLRRAQIVEEANDIGTAYLRLDLLAPDTQPDLRRLFREYLESRLATYRAIPDIPAATRHVAQSHELQRRIWAEAVRGTTDPGAHPSAAVVTLPAINQMIDITTTRAMATRTHPPGVIYVLLFVLCLVCATISGVSMSTCRRRPWGHAIAFALMVSITVFVILDVEYPRLGFVRIDSHDEVLVRLLESFK
jgi:hypothetical protein